MVDKGVSSDDDRIHNEELEAAILASPDDTEPRRIYADWLEERGEDVLAAGHRLLAGVCDDPPTRLQRELASIILGASVWLEECVRGAAGVDHWAEPDPDDWLPAHREAFANSKATWVERDVLLRQVRTSVARAPAEQLHRLMRLVLESVAVTERGPLEADGALAEELTEMDDDCFALDLPLEGDVGSLSFEHVMVSHATVGVDATYWRRGPGSPPPARAFVALAASAELVEDDAYNELSPDERRDWLLEDHLFGEDFEWAPLGLADFFEWAYAMLAANEGNDAAMDGEPMPLLDAVERFGAFRCGVYTDGCEFPFHFFVFDRAYLLSQLLH